MFTENEIKWLIKLAEYKNTFINEEHLEWLRGLENNCPKSNFRIPIKSENLFLFWKDDNDWFLNCNLEKAQTYVKLFNNLYINDPLLDHEFFKLVDKQNFCILTYRKKNMDNSKQSFVENFEAFAKEMYDNNVNKGFWPENRNIGEALALVHSEISEALEGLRQGNPADDKIPQHSCMAAELADAIIRIMDISQGLKLNVGQAIVDKHNFNLTRPHKHGKKF